ncbi:MAG: 30S ribosomal protein S8e [Candidatus Aenigmarchaeota archaeon]|nr:30S ribosomal protein S8e [Candidatus Aenigmarchaeota archaeon]
MTQWRLRSKRGPSGKLIQSHGKKRRMDAGRDFYPATLGKTKAVQIRIRGGHSKDVLYSSDYANVIKDGKCVKAKLVTVKDNPANMQFARRNILSKGAIVDSDIGLIKITSRPGQDGAINAVFVKAK